jgi:hypothetical protein
VSEEDLSKEEVAFIRRQLRREMLEIFSGRNFSQLSISEHLVV